MGDLGLGGFREKISGTPVLVVEDNEVVGKFLVEILQGFNAVPFLCSSSDAALLTIENSVFPIVLLDWNLPGMTGGELCKVIKSHKNYKDSIVLIITGYNEPGRIQEALDFGADDYILKPVSREMLAVRLDIMMSQQENKILRRQAEKEIYDANVKLESLVLERTSQLEQSKNTYQSIIDNINVGIVFVDSKLHIRHINNQMKKWFPALNDIIEPMYYELLHSTIFPCDFCPAIKTFDDSEIHEERFEIIINDEKRVFNVIACPIKNDMGTTVNVVEIIKDITERVQREEEMEKRLQLAEENSEKGNISSLCGLIGSSNVMNDVYRKIKVLASERKTVLLQGETGTGKEVGAKALHQLAEWNDRPFLSVNCGSLPENILESELFGHTKGAFTGAQNNKAGLFVAAGEGSIFLDEIEAASHHTQVALLRVLDQMEVMPIGGREPHKIHARIIIASNRDLEEMVASGEFREDLYYRVCAEIINLPPVRERSEDIDELVSHFFSMDTTNRVKRKLSKKTLAILKQYQWPGNVREIRNLANNLIANSVKPLIHPADLPEQYRAFEPGALPTLEQHEKELLESVLEHTSWNKSDASQILDVSRNTVYSLIKKHGLSNN